MKNITFVVSLLSLMLTLTGCPNGGTSGSAGGTADNTGGNTGGGASPANTVDPLHLEWQAVGPASGSSGSCLGPFYVIASANVTADLTLTLASQVGPSVHFYSTAGCGNETATITVMAGTNTSGLYYLADLDTAKAAGNAIYTVAKGNTAIVYSSVAVNNYN